MRERILIVSDGQRGTSMRESLAQQGFSATISEDANDGYGQLLASRFDLVIVNVNEAAVGSNLVKRIRTNPELRRVQILAVAEWGTGQPTMTLTEGANGFEPGPVNGERLVAAVVRLMRPNLTMTARASGADRDDD